MSLYNFFIYEYHKLSEYVFMHENDSYIYTTDGSKIKFTMKYMSPGSKKISIDSVDFMKLEIFLVEKGIRHAASIYTKNNIIGLIRGNNVDALEYLAERNFCESTIDSYDIIKFFIQACEIGSIDVIMILLSCLNITMDGSKEYLNELMWKTFKKIDEEIICMTMQNISEECIDSNLAINMSVKGNHIKSLLILNTRFAHIDKLEYLETAIVFGSIDIVIYMVSIGADLQAKLDKSLWIFDQCGSNGYIEMIEYLLERVTFSDEQLDEFLRKSYCCRLEYVDLLIDGGADFVAHGERLYRDALSANNVELAAYLKKNYL